MKKYKLTLYMIGGTTITATITTDLTMYDYMYELAETDCRIITDAGKITVINMRNCAAAKLEEG